MKYDKRQLEIFLECKKEKKLSELQINEDAIFIGEDELEETVDNLFSYFEKIVTGWITKNDIEGMIVMNCDGNLYQIWITTSQLYYDLNCWYTKVYDSLVKS
jgi:hypothetical protein